MANTKKKRRDASQTRREIWGVCFIALAVFLGYCIYFGQSGIVGEAITTVLFGLMGLFAHAAPVVLLAGGILFIAHAGSAPQRGRTALVVLGVFFIITLLHVTTRAVLGDTPYFDYIKDAYRLGEAQLKGGGALGALLSYPLLLLTGEAGAYIFLIAGILIVILLVTRLSLRETGRKVSAHVAAGIHQAEEYIASRRQPLYMEDLAEEAIEEAPPPRRRKRKRSVMLDLEPEPPAPRPRRRTLAEEGADLTFMPSEGPIRKRPREERILQPDEGEEYLFDEAFDGDAFAPDFHYESWQDNVTPFPGQEGGSLHKPKRRAQAQEVPPAATIAPKPFENIEPPAREHPAQARPSSEAAPQAQHPYTPPPVELLNPARANQGRGSNDSPAEVGKLLVDTLASFNVSAKVINISVGPVITRYELAPAPGVRVNRITALSDDIALALAAPRVRIEAPIPGKAAVGVEVPNKDTVTVVLRDIIENREFQSAKSPITLALGKDIAGKVIVADLAKMPHLLIAGATGSGKSVCINDIIISLVYKCTPEELSLILVDPKVVELSSFGCLPHLKVPVVTDPKKAAGALAAGVREMTDRYKKFAAVGARDLERYNALCPEEQLPKLVIIIDELADLMMVAPDTVEDSICRIAQLGRASGIHLIVATQRPSADIITGLIKANIPSRIAFAVSSAIDSRIILDSSGAEKLLGRGDMLFHPNGAGKAVRVQGAYVSDEEVQRIAAHFESMAITPAFDAQLIEEMDDAAAPTAVQNGNSPHEDVLLGDAVRIVLDSGQASISMIQRRLRVGYARAARLVDIMEQNKFIGPGDGSKPRKLLITRAQYEQLFGEGAQEAEEAYDIDE